jgi:NADH-quinone oxidoreductase subunit N
MAIALFSLAGIPPTAGFFGKYFLLTSGAAKGDYLVLTVAVLNMIVSLFYYLRIVKAMFIDKSETDFQRISVSPIVTISLVICIAGVLLTGMSGEVYEQIKSLFLASN